MKNLWEKLNNRFGRVSTGLFAGGIILLAIQQIAFQLYNLDKFGSIWDDLLLLPLQVLFSVFLPSLFIVLVYHKSYTGSIITLLFSTAYIVFLAIASANSSSEIFTTFGFLGIGAYILLGLGSYKVMVKYKNRSVV